MSVEPGLYRRAMSRLATGVTVVTARSGDRYELMTANAVMSVSLQPTLLLVSATENSRWLRAVRDCRRFTVNVLGHEQAELAAWCADRARHDSPDHVLNFDIHVSNTGHLQFTDALAVFECVLTQEHPAGDHVLVLGEVEQALVGEDLQAQPLVFVQSGFTTTSPAREAIECATRQGVLR